MVANSNPPQTATEHGIDYQVAAGSLPLHFRRDLQHFPRRNGYLVADPQRVAYWRERFTGFGGGLKVGFCWRSSNQIGVRELEYSSLSQWGPIFAVPGVHFVNLQYDQCMSELDQARSEFGVTLHHFPEVDMFDDLDETATLMEALQLVNSAQTAVSGQATALGIDYRAGRQQVVLRLRKSEIVSRVQYPELDAVAARGDATESAATTFA